ncbi:hypothetical protein R6Q59_007435 [Mikania micrantha]
MKERKEKVIETLFIGRHYAHKLRNFLHLKLKVDGSVLLKDLLTEIVGSFFGGLLMLNPSDSGNIRGDPTSLHVVFASPVDRTPVVGAGKKNRCQL